MRRLTAALAAAALLLPGESVRAARPAPLGAGPAQAFEDIPVPTHAGWVTDLAGLLTPAQRTELSQLMAAFSEGDGPDVVLLTVPDLGGQPIENLALAVARQWQLGSEERHDGALLLVARDDRALRIEVGRGLEGVLPDAICRRIVDEVIVPHFRAGDFAAGLRAGIEAIHATIGGEYDWSRVGRGARQQGIAEGLITLAILAFIMISITQQARRGGRVGGMPWLFFPGPGLGRGHGGGFGGFGGGGFGGGGFGGFGGGGGFSGGGASGRW